MGIANKIEALAFDESLTILDRTAKLRMTDSVNSCIEVGHNVKCIKDNLDLRHILLETGFMCPGSVYAESYDVFNLLR